MIRTSKSGSAVREGNSQAERFLKQEGLKTT